MLHASTDVKSECSNSVLIPVLNSKTFKSWPKHAEGGEAKYTPIADAFADSYGTDAHFAAYGFAGKARRLSTKAIDQIDGGVEMRAIVFDVDGKDHKASDEWWEEERAKVGGLLALHPGGFVYRTRGGYRIVYLAPLPIYVRDDSDRYAWWALYRAWVNYLGRRFAIVADPGCKDWTRLFRLPKVVRDGVREEREIIGDAASIGQWHCELTAADMADLDGVAKKTVSPAGKYSGNYRGRGRLLDAFDRRGWLGHEIEPGKVACRCPWEQSHSMGSTYDTSTVIYEADTTRGELGWFHCSHGHCQDRPINEVIAEFTDEEMGNAPKCGATTSSGKTCAATELMSDGRCEFHTKSKASTTDTTAPTPNDEAATSTSAEPQYRLIDLGEALTPDLIASQQEPVSTGIAEIDAQLGGGYFAGELAVTQASTGVGKTSLNLFIQCTGIASDPSRPGLYVSTEMQPHELQARRACQVLNAQNVRCTWRDVLRGVIPLEKTKAATANTGVKVLPMRPSQTAVSTIRAAAIELGNKYGKAPFIIADYLQALSLGTGEDRRIAVGTTVYELQALAAELRTPIVAISSISRAGNAKDKRDSDDPYDFLNISKEAGEIELAAAALAHLDVKAEADEHGWRDARFILCKTRFGNIGIVGLKFHGASGLFRPDLTASLSEMDRKVIEVVRSKCVSSANDVAEHIKRNRPAVLKSVRRLRSNGVIKAGPTGVLMTSVLTDQAA